MKTIFRTIKVCKYTQISNEMLRNPKLSLKAKGMLAMILTHSDEWVVTKSWLEGICLEGRDSIRSTLDELQAAGYARYDGQEKDNAGQFSRSSWTFFEEPIRAGETVDGFPVDGKPATKKTISEEDCLKEKHIVGKSFPTPKPANPSREPAAAPNNPNLEANPEAEPTGSGRETPPVPRPPLTQKTQIRTKYTPRARNPLLDALAALGGASLEHMTPTEWGRAAKALKDIRSVKPDLTVEDIRIASDNYTKLYGSAYLTSTALSNNWSKVRPGVVVAERTQSPAQKPPTRWEIEKEIERISMALSVHEGYIDSTKCDLMTRTPEQKADADALIEKRKALRAKLLTFPSAP